MMACCGEKLVNIAKGNISLGVEKLFGLEVMKSAKTDARTRICHGCEKATWLTLPEYIAHLRGCGIKYVESVDDLKVIPELPIRLNRPKCRLFCAVCKCSIPAKVRVDEEKCPMGKW